MFFVDRFSFASLWACSFVFRSSSSLLTRSTILLAALLIPTYPFDDVFLTTLLFYFHVSSSDEGEREAPIRLTFSIPRRLQAVQFTVLL